MHVELRLPAEWSVVIANDGAVRATSSTLPGVEIAALPFSIVVDRKREWASHIMCTELATGIDNLTLRVDDPGETEDGWPTWFVVAARRDTEEARAFAFYHFLDYSSAAIVRGPNVPPLLDLLRRARPSYATDDVVALEQLWE